jgi:hypothetical protein
MNLTPQIKIYLGVKIFGRTALVDHSYGLLWEKAVRGCLPQSETLEIPSAQLYGSKLALRQLRPSLMAAQLCDK